MQKQSEFFRTDIKAWPFNEILFSNWNIFVLDYAKSPAAKIFVIQL